MATTERAVAASLLMHSVLPSWKSAVERAVCFVFLLEIRDSSVSIAAGFAMPSKYIATLSGALRIFDLCNCEDQSERRRHINICLLG
ncbi:hypothetical protein Bsp3421_000461 (plasmid) [Burkholderia sp. FERM BP-3421]|uniref:hypothetical protein n=1 Tax=Burkholderia sp. FERM BP-3421 TaxID=1494466 RepID=UPI0023608B02|nr:hypothetical protein [Burkholderia sp. FERM BP-3421]WDD90601.1 hypothetical protein Bsp3421_000461 [Burkholderia sp. FERM BP-3421]